MSLHTDNHKIPSPVHMFAAGKVAMVKVMDISYDVLASVLKYDPEAGTFTWLVRTAPLAAAGSPAGTWLKAANGKKYLSITYKGRKMAAGQVAWFLHYGEWPARTVQYIDENSENLRISNLKKADFVAERVIDQNGVTRYKMGKEQVRHYGLARYYGLTLTQYAEMFQAQNGRCAICDRPETAKIPGRKTEGSTEGVRDLSVDHDHVTGAVRQLLCNACNHMLGEAGDDANRLRAAADYIEFHQKRSSIHAERLPNENDH